MAMLIVRERRVKQKALYKNNAVSVADTLYPKVTPTSSLLHACADDALGCRIGAKLNQRFIPALVGKSEFAMPRATSPNIHT